MNRATLILRRRFAPLVLIVAAGLTALAGCTTAAVPAPTAPPGSGQPTTSASPSGGPASSAPESNPPGDIPDNQLYVAYAPRGGGFQVKVPEGWAQSTGAGGAVIFTDKLNSVQISRATGRPQPTPDSVKAAVATAEGPRPGFAAGAVASVDRKGGSAIRAAYRVDSTADPVTGKVVNDDVELYVFWRNGVEVDLRVAGPRGADNVDPWRIITDSFRWTP